MPKPKIEANPNSHISKTIKPAAKALFDDLRKKYSLEEMREIALALKSKAREEMAKSN